MTTATRKLTKKELANAIAIYAQRHGLSRSLVRTCASMRLAAIAAWLHQYGENNR